jgi:PAS domain S-box-containing protein
MEAKEHRQGRGTISMSELKKFDDGWEDRYQHLVEEAEDMLYLIDEDGRYALVNDSMAELTGYAKQEIVGQTPAKLLSDEDLHTGQNRIKRLLEAEDQESDTWTVTLITKDGQRIPTELRFKLLQRDDGSYNGIVGVARDIRERKRREQKLQVMTRLLRHNIRNKLGLVMGKADLLGERATDEAAEAASDEEIREMTENIAETAEEMVRLSEKVRTIQERIRANPEDEEHAEIARLARAVVQQFRASYEDAQISIDAPEELWATVSESYEVALSELIENGIHHYEANGSPQVAVDIYEENGTVVTAVSDNCPPIPESEKRVIREEEETALSHSAGVGLWLVYWVVKAANGEMTFDENRDGNTVTLRFETADIH